MTLAFAKSILSLTAVSLLALTSTASFAQFKFINIGTGGISGVNYVVGQAICRLVNRGTTDHKLTCIALSTGGSIDNINNIRAGYQDMGLAQSDWQYHAYNGSAKFEGNKFEKVRAVFSVHSEPFTVIARKDSNISSFDDLSGKRVNVGNPGSGKLATLEVVLDAKGWTMEDFSLASQLQPVEQAAALGDNKVDAIAYTVGHPNATTVEATSTVDANLVNVGGPEIEKLIADNPYYAKATIPGGMYAGNDNDISTFGVKATFVTTADVDEDTVYQVVKAVFDNFDRFKKLHPAFATLKQEEMIADGLSAPLHDGAAKYYKEQGWM